MTPAPSSPEPRLTLYRVIYTADMPKATVLRCISGSVFSTRESLLDAAWHSRRALKWRAQTVDILDRTPVSTTRHEARLHMDFPERPDPDHAVATLAIDVALRQGESLLDKAEQLLDLPIDATPLAREAPGDSLWSKSRIAHVYGRSLIGPMPDDWPCRQILTRYSHHLGSYGQGGIGLSGWQINGGSWMVLPLKNSAEWITLTREEIAWSDDPAMLSIAIDQRIISVYPDQIADFPPWEHGYAGHAQFCDLPDFAAERLTVSSFATDPSGFSLEAINGLVLWRFAMGDHLPRPIWGGVRKPRLLCPEDSIAGAFILTHDCYLDV